MFKFLIFFKIAIFQLYNIYYVYVKSQIETSYWAPSNVDIPVHSGCHCIQFQHSKVLLPVSYEAIVLFLHHHFVYYMYSTVFVMLFLHSSLLHESACIFKANITTFHRTHRSCTSKCLVIHWSQLILETT